MTLKVEPFKVKSFGTVGTRDVYQCVEIKVTELRWTKTLHGNVAKVKKKKKFFFGGG